MHNCEDVARLVMKTQGRSSTRVDQREGKKKVSRCWCGTVSRVDQEGWGWVGNGRNGGQEGLEGTNTEQHNEENQTFGHQRQMDSIRWPAPDCGLERIRAIVGWIGSVTGIVQLSKSHQASVAVLSAQWQEDLGG